MISHNMKTHRIKVQNRTKISQIRRLCLMSNANARTLKKYYKTKKLKIFKCEMAENTIPISIVDQNWTKAPLNLQTKLLSHILILLVHNSLYRSNLYRFYYHIQQIIWMLTYMKLYEMAEETVQISIVNQIIQKPHSICEPSFWKNISYLFECEMAEETIPISIVRQNRTKAPLNFI